MGSLNKVMLIGRLGKDPEIRYTQSGSAVAHFSLATSEYWKDKQGQRQEKTEWHNVIAWDRLADLAQNYLKKGAQVYIEGRLQTSSWDDQQGQKRYKTEVVAAVIQFLESRQGGDPSVAEYGASTYSAPKATAMSMPPSPTPSPLDTHPDPSEMYIKDDMPF